MNIVENSKQFDFLMSIKNVGMQIIFKKCNEMLIFQEFYKFNEYIIDDFAKIHFFKSLEKILTEFNQETLTPDNLLLELGQYTPYIIFDDDIDEEQSSLDDSCFFN